MTESLTTDEKRGVAAIIDWIDTASAGFLIQLQMMESQLEVLNIESAEELDRFVAATNMRATLSTAMTERQRIDQLKAKLIDVLGLEGH